MDSLMNALIRPRTIAVIGASPNRVTLGNVALDNLANYIFQYGQEYFQNTHVRCRMDLPTSLPAMHVDAELRYNLFLALKEALKSLVPSTGQKD